MSIKTSREDTQDRSKMIQRSSAGNGDQKAWDPGSLQAVRASGSRGYGVADWKGVMCDWISVAATGAMGTLREHVH
jgi:hypothetical protein